MVACANIPNLEKNEKISNISNISIKNSSQDFDLTFHSEKWWLVLNDSSLNHLIELVLKNNKSLQIAKLNIKKSEEAINLSKSSKNLDISFRSGLTRVETRENPLKNLTGKDNYSLYNIGLQTSYEFDLFDKFDNSIKEKEYQNIIYMLATTSDKKINYRKYDDDSVIEMSDNGSYMTPYNKPVLKNHDDWNGEPLGRVLDSFTIDHKTLSYKSPYNSELPEDVMEFFKENNCFKDGKTSIILKCFVDDNTINKIKDGYYLTVSQGITCLDIICNVCGETFFKCPHRAGSTYKVNDVETECIPKAIGPFIAEEISIVNIPANDTSIIYVPEKKEEKNAVTTSDNKNIKNQAQIDNQENQCKDNKNNNNIKDNKGDSTMLKDLLRKSLLKLSLIHI